MIYRGKIGKIYFEFIPAKGKAESVIVLCEGLPSVPKQKTLMEALSSQGFFVMFPRYAGTWESGGRFLRKSPAADIKAVINQLNKGYCIDLFSNRKIAVRTKKLNLIGSSFGGSVALVMSNWERINKVIALSPVIDFTGQGGRSEQDLMRLMNYIRRAFGYAYRFGKKDWLKLVSGRILKPAEINNAKKEKILIFLDKLDREVDYKKIYRFAETNGLKTIQVSNLGHLSFSKLKGSLLKRAVQWLKTNN